MRHIKPWDETWTLTFDEREEPCVGFESGYGFCLFEFNCDGYEEEQNRERAKLVAAAPDLYRALKALEWQSVGDMGYTECPVCGCNGPRYDLPPPKHLDGCTLAAALRKAEGK